MFLHNQTYVYNLPYNILHNMKYRPKVYFIHTNNLFKIKINRSIFLISFQYTSKTCNYVQFFF
jgi:hypothetical protein